MQALEEQQKKNTQNTKDMSLERHVRGVFSPHLPCEMAEANFRRFQWFSPRFLSIFTGFPVIFNQFQSASVSFNQFQSVWLGRKRRNLLTTGRWGKQHLRHDQKIIHKHHCMEYQGGQLFWILVAELGRLALKKAGSLTGPWKPKPP